MKRPHPNPKLPHIETAHSHPGTRMRIPPGFKLTLWEQRAYRRWAEGRQERRRALEA